MGEKRDQVFIAFALGRNPCCSRFVCLSAPLPRHDDGVDEDMYRDVDDYKTDDDKDLTFKILLRHDDDDVDREVGTVFFPARDAFVNAPCSDNQSLFQLLTKTKEFYS